MRRNKGFTLPEMLVVILLMAVLLGFAVPSINDSWQQAQLDFAVQQLHRDIRWAQREGVRTQQDMQITYYKSNQPNTYTVRYAGNPKNLRRRELPVGITAAGITKIKILKNKQFDKNGHIVLQRGEHERYVYFYQTGRSRITKAPTT